MAGGSVGDGGGSSSGNRRRVGGLREAEDDVGHDGGSGVDLLFPRRRQGAAGLVGVRSCSGERLCVLR